MKTLIQMIKETCDHHDINMSLDDMDFLVTCVPSDIPWSEDGIDFITGMVLGWDSYENRKKARKECSKYKYTLWLSMYTGDDAEILYNGNSYCWYADKLKISKGFDSMKEAISFIVNKIEVKPGYKASEYTEVFLKECCDLIEEGDFPISHNYSGNQEFDFSLDMNM